MPHQASPRCVCSPVPVPGHLHHGIRLELSKAPVDMAFLSFSFYAFGSSVACVNRYPSLQAAVMFSHGANPPLGEAFSTGRVQARPDEDKPIEWGLPGNPQPERSANGCSLGRSFERLQLCSALSKLSFFKAATELGDGAGVSSNSTKLTILTKFQPFFLT